MNARDADRLDAALEKFTEPSKRWTDRTSEEVLRAFAARVQGAGAQPIFIVPPNPQQNRTDFVHLNDVGAREFTKLLAERFVEFLAMPP